MKNIRVFLSEKFQFLEVKFFIYLNRRVFVMILAKDVKRQSCSGQPLQTSPEDSSFKFIIDFPLIR